MVGGRPESCDPAIVYILCDPLRLFQISGLVFASLRLGVRFFAYETWDHQ